MGSARRFKKFVLGISLAGLLLVGSPATASADGYYHYLAWDTYHSNVWPSAKPIKRMYWHYGSNGYGASIKCDIAGVDFDWVWFPMYDDGGHGFAGCTNQKGCYLWAYVIRFDGQTGPFTLEPNKDPTTWSGNAWVRIVVIYDGEVVGFADEVLHYTWL